MTAVVPGHHLIGDGGRVLDGPDIAVRCVRVDPNVAAMVWEVAINGVVQPWRVAADSKTEAELTARFRLLQQQGVYRR